MPTTPLQVIITAANTVSRASVDVSSPPETISVTISATSMTVTATASTSDPNGSPTRCATTSAWCTAASTAPASSTAGDDEHDRAGVAAERDDRDQGRGGRNRVGPPHHRSPPQDLERLVGAVGGHQQMVVAEAGEHVAADPGVGQRAAEECRQPDLLERRVHAQRDPRRHVVVGQAELVGPLAPQDDGQPLVLAHGRLGGLAALGEHELARAPGRIQIAHMRCSSGWGPRGGGPRPRRSAGSASDPGSRRRPSPAARAALWR